MNGRVQEFLISRARKIERALVRRSWTRVHLAELTGYDERTIRNVLGAKPVRDQTIIDICQALGIEPDLEDCSEYVEVLMRSMGSARAVSQIRGWLLRLSPQLQFTRSPDENMCRDRVG